MIELLRPRFAVPIHGEYRHMVALPRAVRRGRHPAERVLLPEIGGVIEFTRKTAPHTAATCPPAPSWSTASATAATGRSMLRDREHLADDGVVRRHDRRRPRIGRADRRARPGRQGI